MSAAQRGRTSSTGASGSGTVLGFPVSTWATLFLVALVIGFVAGTWIRSTIEPTPRLGDFPAFYAAGSIVRDGDVADLYDPNRQLAEQAPYLDDFQHLLFFSYPPPVAAAYSVLARLPYFTAYAIHGAVMAGLTVSAFYLVRPLLPSRRPPDTVFIAGAFAFAPLLLGVTHGQNVAVLVFLLAAFWRLMHAERDALAGVALALLFYKPQYALPILGLSFLKRRPKVVLVGAIGALVWWAGGAAMLGVDWLSHWVGTVEEFNAQDAAAFSRFSVSWFGMARSVFGVGSPTSLVVAVTASVATAAVLAWVWSRRRPVGAVDMAVATPGLLLMSPHSQTYDAGLLTVALVALVVAGFTRSRRVAIVGYALGWTIVAQDLLVSLGLWFTPVALAVVGAFFVAVRWWFVSDRSSGRAVAPSNRMLG